MGIPDWFLNRQRDIKDGKTTQVMANILDNKLREDLERLKKIRAHRGLRHYWGLRVRGQHTKTTGHKEKPWVCPRRSKMYTSALLMSNKQLEKKTSESFILFQP